MKRKLQMVCLALLIITLTMLFYSCIKYGDNIDTNTTEDQSKATTASNDTDSDTDTTGDETDYTPANTISESWEVFGAVYRSSGVIIKENMSDKFSYTTNDENEIVVRSPSDGTHPIAAIQSIETVPLKDLSVNFQIDEDFSFDKVKSFAPKLAFAWTDTPITRLPKFLDALGSSGYYETAEIKAYALTVVFMSTNDEPGSTVADYMYIILYDGTGTESRVGLHWTLKTDTDLSQPVKVEVKEDEELGYVVHVNGVAYREGTRGDQTLPIDLKPIKDISKGHILFGGWAAGNENITNFTLKTINGKPAGAFFD